MIVPHNPALEYISPNWVLALIVVEIVIISVIRRN